MNHTQEQGNLQSILDTDTGPYPKVTCMNVTAGEENIMCAVQIDLNERQGNMLCQGR